MNRQRNNHWIRLLSLCLIFVMTIPSYASAAVIEPVTPNASYYLETYSAYTYPAGSGKIQVYFDVMGVTYMDDIGALSIRIYESTDNSNWTWVKTFKHTDTSSMLGHDAYYHASHVTYQGVAGRYYKAIVCIWAGKDDDGDSRYYYTSSKKAT